MDHGLGRQVQAQAQGEVVEGGALGGGFQPADGAEVVGADGEEAGEVVPGEQVLGVEGGLERGGGAAASAVDPVLVGVDQAGLGEGGERLGHAQQGVGEGAVPRRQEDGPAGLGGGAFAPVGAGLGGEGDAGGGGGFGGAGEERDVEAGAVAETGQRRGRRVSGFAVAGVEAAEMGAVGAQRGCRGPPGPGRAAGRRGRARSGAGRAGRAGGQRAAGRA